MAASTLLLTGAFNDFNQGVLLAKKYFDMGIDGHPSNVCMIFIS